MKIKRIGVRSSAKVFGALNAFFGFLFGCFFALFTFFIGVDQTDGTFALLFGMGAPVALALIYGVMGFAMGALMAWIYNALSRVVGPFEIEVE
jgi:hypothetical protein